MLFREGLTIALSIVGSIDALKETIIGSFEKLGTMLFEIKI